MVGIADFKTWARALRLPFLTATAVPALLGASVAYWEAGAFNWLLFLLSLVGVAFLHLGTNLANDYYDHKSGNDEANSSPTPFSGGSRVIQEGLIAPKAILITSLTCFTLGISIGLLLYWMTENMQIIAIGCIGVLIGFFYTASPLKLGYRGIGELLTGIGFGPLVVAGTYAVQVGSISSAALLASMPIGILVGLILFINEFPDYEADKKVGKKTWVVLMGKRNAVKLFHALLLFTYLFVGYVVFVNIFPLYTLVVFLTLPLAIKAYLVSRKNFESIKELLPANGSTIMLHLSFGLLLSLGFVLDRLL